MKLGWALAISLLLSGCAAPAVNHRYERAGPSEAYVDLRPFVFNGKFVTFDSPRSLVDKYKSLGGAQGKLETNSEFRQRVSGLGLYAVMSELKDYNIEFDKDSGSLGFRMRLDDAQGFGFRENGQLIQDFKRSFYSAALPDIETKKGEFVGQNSYGAKTVVQEVEIDRVYLVGPGIPKAGGAMLVDLVAKLNISSAEFQRQRSDLRIAIIVEPVPNYLQVEKSFGSATMNHAKESTVSNYFVSAKFAAVSVVNVKSKSVVSDQVRVRFKNL